MEYKVISSRRARKDLTAIGDYITKELYAPQTALDLMDEIDIQLIGLRQMPKRYAQISDDRLARSDIRSIPVKNYLIFYVVDDAAKTVNVLRVLYSRRDWTNLL